MGWVVFHAQVAWIPCLLFLSVVPASIIIGFFIPLTLLSFFFLPFRLLGGLWVSRLYRVYFRCLGRGSSQSSSLATAMCCKDNCCNYFVNCSTSLVCVEPTIPLACGPTLCLILSSIDHGASGKISYSKLD